MSGTILVPVDDSSEAPRAVEQAGDLAARLGAGLTLLTVLAVPLLPEELLEPAQLERFRRHFREAGEQVLARLRLVAEGTGVPVETKCVEGVPADEIVAEARNGYLFIVMGGRGTGLAGQNRVLLGSVSDRVLR